MVIDLESLDQADFTGEQTISSITLAELISGPHATDDPLERAARLERLLRIESLMNPLPFDVEAARAYGRVYAATRHANRKPRGARVMDLLIASVAMAHQLPLITRNPEDVAHLTAIGLAIHVV